MKKLSKLLSLYIFLFSTSSIAASFSVFPLNLETRMVQNENRDYSFVNLTNYALSFGFWKNQFLLEHVESSNFSGNQTLNFTEVNEEFHLNYLYNIVSPYRNLHLFIGAGSGIYKYTLKTRYLNSETEDNSGNTLFVSGLISLQYYYQFIHTQIDFRLFEGKDYQPQPQPGLILRVGFRFN